MDDLKKIRSDVLKIVKDNNVNYFEWKLISSYIEQLYENIKEKSTL